MCPFRALSTSSWEFMNISDSNLLWNLHHPDPLHAHRRILPCHPLRVRRHLHLDLRLLANSWFIRSEMKKLKICWICSSDLMFPVAKKLHKFYTSTFESTKTFIWELSIYLSLLNFKM